MNWLYIIEVVVGFGFLIAIHEAGHFMAARRAGIACPVFSVGFPLPRFLTKLLFLPDRWRNIVVFKKGGTEYRIGWIPFGGFVQMKGQNDDRTVELEQNEGSRDDFRNVSFGNKALVICGGVIMNAITGIVFFVIAFMVFGVTFIDPVVGNVVGADPSTGKPTQAWLDNRIQAGDRIKAVNGKEVVDFEDVLYISIFDGTTPRMTFVKPDGTTYEADVPLYHEQRVNLDIPPLRASAAVLIADEEAKRSGGKLQARDVLKAINSVPVNSYEAIEYLLGQTPPGQTVKLTIERGSSDSKQTIEVDYEPHRLPFNDESGYVAGMAFVTPPVVGAVRNNSPAMKAGLQAGDHIRAVKLMTGEAIPGAESDGWRAVSSPAEVRRLLGMAGKFGLNVRFERPGMTREVVLTPEASNEAGGRYVANMTFMPAQEAWKHVGKPDSAGKLVVADVIEGSVAAKAGIVPGMTVTDVPGISAEQKVPSGFFGFLGLSSETKTLTIEQRLMLSVAERSIEGGKKWNEPLTLQIKTSEGEVKNVSIVPDVKSAESTAYMLLDAKELRSEPIHYGFLDSIGQGFYHSHKKMHQILQTLGGLFTGDVSITHLGGPVLIAKRSYDLADYGIGTLLFFLGFISINLAVVNLLPIPVLDGGLLLVTIIEKLKGSPLNERAMGYVNLAAFVAIIGLMLFVVFNDIRHLWG